MTEPTHSVLESNQAPQRLGVTVRGVVQGVGFRPFVYRLATEENLAGHIGNDTDGVTIEIEGAAAHGAGLRRAPESRSASSFAY